MKTKKDIIILPCPTGRIPVIGDLVMHNATRKLSIFDLGSGGQYIHTKLIYYVLSDDKVIKDDYFLGYQIGIRGVESKHFLSYHYGTRISEIQSICEFTNKVLFTNDKYASGEPGRKSLRELPKNELISFIDRYNKNISVDVSLDDDNTEDWIDNIL